MDIVEKLAILSDAAKYDVSCSSSGSTRTNKNNGIGNAESSGICHSFTTDGRCISLLKILMTNICSYDCVYCINRISSDVRRAFLSPSEIAELTINFYKRNYIEGLFLSSAVYKNPDYTMELIIEAVTLLRNAYNFNGYIHIKVIPGTKTELIARAGRLVDRMSVNMELPSEKSLSLLAPQKTLHNIMSPMSFIHSNIITNIEEKRIFKSTPDFVPAGQSTQLIIGATNEDDLKIIRLTENLYKSFKLKRVYYSAYIPVSTNPLLPVIDKPPLLREHRLYQADWLLRFYGFKADELLTERKPFFDTNYDPKTDWALNHLGFFPVEINTAPPRTLLRIPGIGHRSVNKILALRRVHKINSDNLKKLGIVMKRARHFITCDGRYCGDMFNDFYIRNILVDQKAKALTSTTRQLSFFDS
ncbi:MAG TPA: putative DNA modification/repair radical SAM protein [Clostridiaceae bacterium]